MENEKAIRDNPEKFMEDNQDILEQALELNKGKAEKILNDQKKLDKLLIKIEKMCNMLAIFPIPYFREIIEDIPKMLWMIRDYKNKNYSEAPYTSIVAIIAAFIYMVSPIDVLPDAIPVLGVIDDLFILKIVLKAISRDLNAYWKWHIDNS